MNIPEGRTEDRRELERLHLLFTGLAWGLILCGIGLILLLVTQNRLLGQNHESLSATAAQLAETHGVLTLQNQRFDKGFIQNMTSSSDASAIVEIVTDLGKKLGIRTTAEGVETEEQLSYLQLIGCTQVQG
ncbi:EAL domain-containing protein [Aurantimonas sp. A2-1-M11]|uniref:EAL domain-containing protein n=1 Tax=Aurantimonas sp. A2-1-M11 TaxID=3113712 RepID=UPI002F929C68